MRFWLKIILTILATLLLLFVLPLLGNKMISPVLIFSGDHENYLYRSYWEVRFPPTLLAMIAGAGLSVAGMVFQALFRNPLATPFTLGVSSGASFGVTFYLLVFRPFLFLGLGGDVWFSFVGTMLAMMIVYFLARSRNISSEQMLLAGVAVSFFFSSLILFMQYLSDQSQMFQMIRWVMGGLGHTPPSQLWFLVPTVLLLVAVLCLFSRELNLIVTGYERAMTVGVDVAKLRMMLFFLTSILVGTIVSFCGPIGFVGLVVPHLCRLVYGPDHRVLGVASALAGGIFLAICDVISRSILGTEMIPVGVITSLIGGPFFLWLLLQKNALCVQQ